MFVPAHLRWPFITVGGVGLAVASGLLAAWAQTGGWDTLRFVAFGLCLVVPYMLLLDVVTAGPERTERAELNEDSVEHAWARQALSGAAIDLFIVLGVLTAFTSILGLDEPGTGLMLLLLMGDVAVRYLLLSRRRA